MQIVKKYEHSKLGNFMFNLCAKWTEFLIKHKWLYFLLLFTWALPVTLIGLVMTLGILIVRLFNKNIKFSKYGWMICVNIGPDYWGGFSLGTTFLRDQKSAEAVSSHEFGHSFQLVLFGVFFLFIVAIPSVIRWWIRALNKAKQYKPYDAIWFEDSASECGKYVSENFSKNKIK